MKQMTEIYSYLDGKCKYYCDDFAYLKQKDCAALYLLCKAAIYNVNSVHALVQVLMLALLMNMCLNWLEIDSSDY